MEQATCAAIHELKRTCRPVVEVLKETDYTCIGNDLSVLQIRRGNRDNLGTISQTIGPEKKKTHIFCNPPIEP